MLETLMLDSGAYSAWNLGGHVDLDEYIEFCKASQVDYYVNGVQGYWCWNLLIRPHGAGLGGLYCDPYEERETGPWG